MTVHITPASEEDARVIAAQLESGICPWPGYEMIALTGQPWTFVLPQQAAGELLTRLYAGELASFSATGVQAAVAPDEPVQAQRLTLDGDAVIAPAQPSPPPEPQADPDAQAQPEPEPERAPEPQPQPQPEPEPAPQPEPQAVVARPEPTPPAPAPARARTKGRGKTGSTQTNVK